MIERFSEKAGKKLLDYLDNNRGKARDVADLDDVFDRLGLMTDLYMPAAVYHQDVFPKYKGVHKGKNVVIAATGPTYEYYRPMEDCIHIGVNRAFFRKDIKFDYLFVVDGDAGSPFFNEIFALDYDIIKFLGFNCGARAHIPECYGDRADVERFYTENYSDGRYGSKLMRGKKFVLRPDISASALRFYGSSIHCAFQFALWTHPDRIYLVGADCSGRVHAGGLRYDESEVKSAIDFSTLINPWRKIKAFTDSYYPDIEIVSINPVGLKGLFKDEYTETYKMSLK